MSTNDLPPSYEDAIKTPPPPNAPLSHHYSPPPPLSPLPPTAPHLPHHPHPYAVTNGTPDTLPTYHYPPTVVVPSNQQQISNTSKAIRSCFFAIFTIIFLIILVFIFMIAMR